MPRKLRFRDRTLVERKRVILRCNEDQFELRQSFAHDGGRHQRQSSGNPEAGAAIEQRLKDPAQGFDIKTQWRAGKLHAKFLRRRGDRLDRHKHIDNDRKLRLEPLGHSARPRLHGIDAGNDAAGIGKKNCASAGQRRITAASVEERHADLGFERAHHFADGGLRAMQLSRGAREAPLLDGRDKSAQLVERNAVEHDRSIGHIRWIRSKYNGYSNRPQSWDGEPRYFTLPRGGRVWLSPISGRAQENST